MPLEDHVGDIVRKGRLHAHVSEEQAAAAATLSVDQFRQLEQLGKPELPPDYAALGALLQLDAAKLEAIARGWHPGTPDLAIWRELRHITTVAEEIRVHCYLIWDEVTREGALFDTGWEAGPVLALLQENQVELKHLFLTHTHEDHLAALGDVRARFPKIRLHSNSRNAPPDQRNRPTDFIHLGSIRITNRDTPGHAEDGVTYIVGGFPDDAPNIAIVGDALFAGSMGQARDNPGLAREKIIQQIFSLPDDTLVCPGHGPLTTVAEEKRHNPFF